MAWKKAGGRTREDNIKQDVAMSDVKMWWWVIMMMMVMIMTMNGDDDEDDYEWWLI